jgi:hypothetical protein
MRQQQQQHLAPSSSSSNRVLRASLHLLMFHQVLNMYLMKAQSLRHHPHMLMCMNLDLS